MSVLDSISRIISIYFTIKPSVLLPGLLFTPTSNSSNFVSLKLERLTETGASYIKAGFNEGVRKVVNLYVYLAKESCSIKYIGSSKVKENPIFMLCRGYLDFLVQVAIEENSMEALYRASIAYNQIGQLVIRSKLIHEISPIYTSLDKVLYKAVRENMTAVISEVIKSYTNVISLITSDNTFNKIHITTILDHIEALIELLFKTRRAGLVDKNLLTNEITAPLKAIQSEIFKLGQKINDESKNIETNKSSQNKFLTYVEELRRSLRKLSEKLKNADDPIIGELVDITGNISHLLITLTMKTSDSGFQRELNAQIGWYLHQPHWFFINSEKAENTLSFMKIPSTIAFIGMESIEASLSKYPIDSIKVITSIAIEMLEKESGRRHGFTELRIMATACYVGIYAHKKGQTNTVNYLKEKITEFKSAYENKWFPDSPKDNLGTPHTADQLKMELVQYQRDFTNYSRSYFTDDPLDEFMRNHIDAQDIRSFIEEVWGTS